MYDDIADGYNKLHAEEQQRKFSIALPYLDLRAGQKVADIGCATAHLSKYFEDQEYIGVEPSLKLLQKAPEGIRVLHADGEEIPLVDESQDLVISLTCLHNYHDFKRGIEELERIAKHKLLVSVLKKAENHEQIVNTLKKRFRVEKEIDDLHDTILVLEK